MNLQYRFKKALNNYLSPYVDGNKRPTFFAIQQICPELELITENFAMIQAELENVLKLRENIPLYHQIDPGEKNISNTTPSKWKVFVLYLMGYKPAANCELCPQTCQLLKKIPNLMQAFFSILEPGKSVPIHEGPYLGYLRYHLGLKIPAHNPPSIVVNGQRYYWKTGEAVMFDDSWPHQVDNTSTEMRVVLIIDILRPLPLFPRLINKFATNVLAKYTYGRSVVKRAMQPF